MKNFVLFIFLLSTVVLFGQNRPAFTNIFENGVESNNVSTEFTISAVIDTLHYMDGSPALYTFTNDAGYVYGTNTYGDLGKYQRFDITGSYTLSSSFVAFGKSSVVNTPDELTFVVKTLDEDGAPGTTLHSQTITTNNITPNTFTTFTINPPISISDSLFVGFEWTVAADDSFALLSDEQGAGDNASRPWEMWSDNSFSSVFESVGLNADLWIGITIEEVVMPAVITIAEARKDLDNNLVPDLLGDTVTVKGIVTSPNYQTSNHSYYVDDGTAGIVTFLGGTTTPELALGDEVQITGKIGQFNGLTQIQPFASSDFIILSNGNSVPAPIVLTLTEFFTNPEQYESRLVAFKNLVKVSGTWPASGSVTLFYSDAIDTIEIRIDSDTDIDGSAEPTGSVDIIGLASQFNTYQVLPRYYATDFLPGGTIPVELTSFSANVSAKNVTLNWVTASETNNNGFIVERKSDSHEFISVAFINGKGTSTKTQNYSFTEELAAGKYSYRLKQTDFDGSFTYTNVVEVEVTVPAEFSLMQNYPNPFNPGTTITFSIVVDSKVNLKVFNALGEEVAELLNSNINAGTHDFSFDASFLNSGVYFYRLSAAGIDGNNLSSVKKMMLTK